MTTISVSQIPVTAPTDRHVRWNCEEYIIDFDRATRVLTVEDFEGFEDDGTEITTVITDPERIKDILAEHKPGFPTTRGFIEFGESEFAGRYTIGQEPI